MRLRLIFSFALVVLVSLASVVLLTRLGAAREVDAYLTRASMGLDTLAAQLEAYYQQENSWGSAAGLASVVQMAQPGGRGMGQGMMGRAHLRVADRQGRVVYDSEGGAGRLTFTERRAAVTLTGSRGETVGFLLAEASGPGSMVARGSERILLDRLVNAALISAGIAGLAALLLALLLSYGLLRPVTELTQAAVRLAGGDLRQRVTVRGADELGTLGSAFNHMAASLQRAEDNRRAMTADIAHELRTPIAIQRAHLEALQDGVYPLTVENLQPVLDQTELLTRLVDDLRTLALADAGELRLELAPTGLSALARRVMERFRPEAESRGIRLSLNTPDGELTVPVDAGRVEQICNNLLGNALRHTPEAGQVTLEVARREGWTVLTVTDSGPGIPPEALPRVFERFYRADKSRSRQEGGTGLGLAIARQLALAHHGDLTAANVPPLGAQFTLRLPG